MQALQDEKIGPKNAGQFVMLRHLLESSQLAFTRYFMKARLGERFIHGRHHKLMAHALDKVFTGEITRLIINVPPGYTKTEMAVINFIARGLALNPAARFIHVSYSQRLAHLNSSSIRELVLTEEFQELWPMTLKADSKSKEAWFNTSGGGVYAVPSGGSITGFRAGRMSPGFTGAFIVDDPLKPDDAMSLLKREAINFRFTNTFKSRLAQETVPIIVIMQRVHEDDPTAHMLTGGTNETWHHLVLPVEITGEEVYPDTFTHGIQIKHDLEAGPLWAFKHNEEQIENLRNSDVYTFSAQYQQEPTPLGGSLFKDEWWQFYEEVPVDLTQRIITVDTAQKTAEHNDFSVFQCWGVTTDKKIYLLDQWRGKWEAPQLQDNFIRFYNLCKHGHSSVLSGAYVEDKSSGTGLVQSVRQKGDAVVIPVPRVKDKITRAFGVAPAVQSGLVFLPRGKPWLRDLLHEFGAFTPTLSHAHDDQVDAMMDAVEILLLRDNFKLVW